MDGWMEGRKEGKEKGRIERSGGGRMDERRRDHEEIMQFITKV